MIPKSQQRLTIGILALTLLLTAIFFTLSEGNQNTMLQAACWRVGAILGLIWVAYDDLVRLPKWFFPVIFGSVLIIAFRPKAALILVPIFFILAILRPRRK